MLDELAKETEAIITFAESLQKLSPAQWTWKPNPKRWSVAECVGHLNIFGEHYLSRSAKAMQGSKPLAQPAQNFKSGYWGEKLTNTMKPLPDNSIPSPMSTLGKFDPSKKNRVNANTLNTFIQQRKDMLAQIKQAGNCDLEGLRITSTLGPIIRFKLGDTYRFMVAHDQRHILQMKKVMAEAGFPK